MKFFTSTKLYIYSFIIFAGNFLLGYAVYESKQNLIDSEKRIEHTQQVIYQSVSITSINNEIKTASRDFILTNDNKAIKTINVLATNVFAGLSRLKQLTVDNPIQQRRIDLLNDYMRKRVGFALQATAYRQKYGLMKAIAFVANNNESYYSAPVHKLTSDIEQTELVLLQQRKKINAVSLAAFDQLSIFVFVLMTCFTIVVLLAIRKYLIKNEEQQVSAAKLAIANVELVYQHDEKEKREEELAIANKEITFQSGEKKKRAGELIIANEELSYQSGEKEKRAAELVIADEELSYQSDEKEKRAAELAIANIELLYQNNEKEKRAAELVIANEELWHQNNEKEKRAAELVIANKELSYQNQEKEKRAMELAFANEELIFQSDVRKMAERNLVQSESRLKEAQAIAKTGNFEVDIVKHTEVWSEEMYKIYGIDKAGVTPSKELFFSFIHPDDAGEVAAAMKKSSKSFNSFAAEFRFIRSNGEVRYGYTESRSDRNSKKELVRIYGIVQDITDIRLADIERKNMVNELMVRNNDLEQFAYIISHNLRAPVANIIGASTALNDEDVTDNDKKILKKAINTSVLKLDEVVQDLNHILQVKGNVNATREVVEFSALVNDIKASISNIIEHDVEITCDFSQRDNLLTVKAYLYSIFYNLISNSIKYCQPGIPCKLKIESKLIKNKLCIIFTDNGLGIDLEKNKAQIFGLYKRFHPGLEGKGMGLYMVKTQVESLGGKISIKSKENCGAEFTIEFTV